MSSQPGLRLLTRATPLAAVTGAFALPSAGYFVFLSLRVSLTRIATRVALGDTVPPTKKDFPSSPTTTTPSTSPGPGPGPNPSYYDPLQLATRAHQNYAENVPLALVLAAAAELNGAGPERLTAALAVLLGLRVLHAEFGLSRPDALGFGRPVGYYGTMAVIGWLAGWSAWLVYWG
ncbi:membrane-associated, eicosanoid/glutathione metabolism protein [Hypoxylon sp. FL1150]|nr:membrane-associated, eicosanoid/glutathione metabolism protein [Hypoxylon sp. FL1150]